MDGEIITFGVPVVPIIKEMYQLPKGYCYEFVFGSKENRKPAVWMIRDRDKKRILVDLREDGLEPNKEQIEKWFEDGAPS